MKEIIKKKNRKLPTSLFSWGFFCHKVILTKSSSMSAHECLSISIMMLLAWWDFYILDSGNYLSKKISNNLQTYPCAIIKNKNVVPLHNENTSHSPYASCVLHLSEFPQSILSMDDSIPSSSCESCQVIQFKFWLITSEVWQTVLVWTEKCISLTMYL